jgi:5-methylcytosine-specific restriction protein A
MGKSRHKRGYGSSWNKIRKRILSRDGYLCQTCKRQGIVTYAKIVDHIINKASGGTNADDNLEVICDNCHKEKTQREAQKGKNDGRY